MTPIALTTTDRPLRRVLIADAAVGFLSAVGMLLSTALYAEFTGLPPELLRWAAVILFGYVVALAIAAVLRPIRRRLVVGIIVANGAWVLASLAVLALAPMATIGAAYVAGQALVVVGFGVAEAVTLRRVQD